ncbi:MAG: endonuclease/exonuclease/phosphatase family protein [Spirochaetaceae bacterium]|jgi:endonuclease/exonuclease/phosphatase family metal-dependent hydrolase|nr:endonuclease/exonuclease/phosphatase family protein [Spirochaetaceae bacterium]
MEKILFIGFLAFWFLGCETSEKLENFEKMRIITWNMQALFDGQETGREYDDYRASAGWTEEKYRGRLNTFALGLKKISDPPPDILGLIEIENSQVLADLAEAFEKSGKNPYNWRFFGANPGGALGLGVLSRIPFEGTFLHSITINGETPPRPLLEIWFRVKDAPFVCFVCHWKSKLGGDDETETLRKASARLILRRLRELRQEYPAIPVIILGDLNENYDEFYRKSPRVLALLPDDPEAAELAGSAQSDFLILSRKTPPEPEHFPEDSLVFYSPWSEISDAGSYYFREAWERIDHFLLSPGLFDETGWEFSDCQVVQEEAFLKADKPYGYNPRTGGGVSDHLPLLLTLTLR